MKTKLYSILILLFSLVSSFCQPRQESIWTVVGSPEGVFKAPAGSVAVDILLGNLYAKTTPQTSSTGWNLLSGFQPSGSLVLTNNLVLEVKSVTDTNFPYTVLTQRAANQDGVFSISRQNRSGGTNDPGSDVTVMTVRHPLNGSFPDYLETDMNSLFVGSVTITGLLYSSGVYESSRTVTTDTTIDEASDYIIYVNAAAGNVTVTLPVSSGVGDRTFWITKIDATANSAFVNGNGSTINGSPSWVITSQFSGIKVHCQGATQWVIQ